MLASGYSGTGFDCKGDYYSIINSLIKGREREGMGRVLVLNYDILKMLKIIYIVALIFRVGWVCYHLWGRLICCLYVLGGGVGGSKFFVLDFWNIQSFGPLKRSPEPKNQVFPMFQTFVTSIFLIFGPLPGIAKIWILTKQLLGDLTGSFFNLQDPWIPFYNRRIHTNMIIGGF